MTCLSRQSTRLPPRYFRDSVKHYIVAVLLLSANASYAAQELTVDAAYDKFNMRSIYSSYAPRLKYFCQSYLKDFFSPKQIVAKTASELVLDNGDDVWTIKITGKNRISVANQIKTGTYNSVKEYDVYFNEASLDWRAKEAAIAVPGKCVTYEIPNP